MLKLKEQIKAALWIKSNAQAAHDVAMHEYRAALLELRRLKVRWHSGQISQRTYQVYKAGTKQLRKDLESGAVSYKKAAHLAHDEHDALITEYAEERRKAEKLRDSKEIKERAEYLLINMCPKDIEALKIHFGG